MTESNGSLPEGGPQVRTYSDYPRAAREAEKEDSIELSRSSRFQMTDSPSKPRTTSFFPLRKLKGNQPLSKKPPYVWHNWRKKMLMTVKTQKVMTLVELRE